MIFFLDSGLVIWKRYFNGYVCLILIDGEYIVVVGMMGNVMFFDFVGKFFYLMFFLSYVNDVVMFKGYIVVVYGKNVEFIVFNGMVEWFESFNGIVYYVGFFFMGYFVVDYGFYEIDNCYSVIVVYLVVLIV